MRTPGIILILFAIAGCSSGTQLARWEFLGGPPAQNISFVLVDADEPSRLYAGLTNGGISVSTNEGRTWTPMASPSAGQPVHRLVQHPRDPDLLYAATGGGLFVLSRAKGEWQEVAMGRPAGPVRAFCIDPWNPAVMYAGMPSRGLSKSIDGGKSWNASHQGIDDRLLAQAEVYDIKVSEADPGLIYAALSVAGVVRSTDGGASWTMLTPGYAASGTVPTHILPSRRERNVLCFGTAAGDLFRSATAGESWSATRLSIPYASRIMALVPDPSSTERIYAGTESGILVSGDFGESWRELSSTLPHLPTALSLGKGRPEPVLYAFGQGIGLQRSQDGGRSWRRADAHLGSPDISRVLRQPEGTDLLVTTGGALYRYEAGSELWAPASSGLTGGTILSVTFDHDSSGLWYAATPGGLFKTTNGGEAWFSFAPVLRGLNIHFFDAHPAIQTRMFANGEQGMMISTDRGASWTRPRSADARSVLHSLTFHPRNATMIFGSLHDQAVLASTNGGLAWDVARYGIRENRIQAVTLDERDPRTCYAWTAHGEGYRSTNAGLEWHSYAPPWTAGATVLVAFDRIAPHDVAALVNGRYLYYSSTAGATWHQVGIEALTDEVTALHWHRESGLLHAGTRHRGVYRLSLVRFLKELRGE